jgi:hypothetical protein
LVAANGLNGGIRFIQLGPKDLDFSFQIVVRSERVHESDA